MAFPLPIEKSRSKSQLAALYSISKALNSTLEVQDVLQTMLDMVLTIFHADAGSVMLEQDGYLTIKVSTGLEAAIVQKTRQKIGSGIAGWVAATGEPLHLDGKVEDPRFEHLIEREESIASSLSVPIAIESKIEGVLMIRRAGERKFDRRDLEFLLSVGDLAAVALQKARLFQAEQRQRHLLELGHQQLRATLSSMADGVLVLGENGNLLTHNEVAEAFLRPLVGEALETFAERFPHCLRQGTSELMAGERLLRIVSTPLLVEGQECGLVLLLRDETATLELERMKSEFLSMVSHELKTPITTIGAFLELLLHRDFEKDRRDHFLSICQEESRRLQSLIEQLLHLTRLEAGGFVLDKARHSFAQLIKDALPAFTEMSSKHKFVLHEPMPESFLDLDPILVTTAIVNLLSNAVKYSPDGGRIDVRLEPSPTGVVLSVSDQGVGIEAEKQKFVFEKFYRADNSLTRSTGGTGLGLANVKHIALAHRGRVWVESALGQGSTFFMELPIERGDSENA